MLNNFILILENKKNNLKHNSKENYYLKKINPKIKVSKNP